MTDIFYLYKYIDCRINKTFYNTVYKDKFITNKDIKMNNSI